MAKALKEGDTAPAIRLETDTGETVQLKDFKGKKVVLYFYPKADTPGCTKESCDFRDHHGDFAGKDAVILGISPDKPAKQAKFKTKFDLLFPLLADVETKVAQAYGVSKEKSMYGKKYMGIERSTFVIDEKGKIARIYAKVKVPGHAADVLSAV